MEIFTLNVGQGQLVVVAGSRQAVVIDTYVPLTSQQPTEFIVGALARILNNKELIGLIITGFDADHFNIVGLKIILNKYNPNWIMYPQYFRETQTARECFGFIQTKSRLSRASINLATNPNRLWTLGTEFEIETFSPHSDDMNSSNNCSLVGKLTSKENKLSYLITGDTENDRWSSIIRYFGNSLSCHVMAAPHHGSKNGVSQQLMNMTTPNTVLISAGIESQFDHPHDEALKIFKQYSQNVFSTSWGSGGQSMKTYWDGSKIRTVTFN